MKRISFDFQQHYLPGKPVLQLAAACECSANGEILRACVTDRIEDLLALDGCSVADIAEKLAIAVLDFSAPWRLQPVCIPKPWGQEIWFTGIEARGVSQVLSDTGCTPLSWALALDQQRVLGVQQSLNLLKILDPLPDEVFGDLYFELHEQKREVYIVTQVDKRAWPDGAGAIRFGFSQDMREQFVSDAEFLEAYRRIVREYRAVRQALDNQMDTLRERDGIASHEPVPALQTSRWLAELPQDLQTQEASLRAKMDAFTAMKPLRVGDVLAVPLYTPHALQHGVRTVEFQTPVYERKILSFAQKVLTQNHWDTDEALQMAQLQTPATEPFPVLRESEGVKIEQIVQFEDFSVQRIHLSPGAEYSSAANGRYRLLMAVVGQVDCAGVLVMAEQAVLVPVSAGDVKLNNSGMTVVELLLAMPA